MSSYRALLDWTYRSRRGDWVRVLPDDLGMPAGTVAKVVDVLPGDVHGANLRVASGGQRIVVYEPETEIVRPAEPAGGLVRGAIIWLRAQGYGVRYAHTCPACQSRVVSGRWLLAMRCRACGTAQMQRRRTWPGRPATL